MERSESHESHAPEDAAGSSVAEPPKAREGAEPASPGPSESGDWKGKSHAFWREWIKPLLIIGLVMFSFRSAVADWNDVPTGSMKPTILEGDRIFINKIAYDLKVPFTTIRVAEWDDPNWGDVVVLLSPEDGKRLVKRVVGLPGDTIDIDGPFLYRNGERAAYDRLDPYYVNQIDSREQSSYHFAAEEIEGMRHPIMTKVGRLDSPKGPFIVPDDHFFVMGDNRGNSRDSRYFGTVHRDEILGRATAVALSLDRKNYFKPRWHRFFTKLP